VTSSAPNLRVRVAIALGAAVFAGALAAHTQAHAGGHGSDYRLLWSGARDVARGIDPYGIRPDGSLPTLVDRFFYPLPAVIIGAPFAWLPAEAAAICFAACAGFALLFAITRDDLERVPIVLSIPFIVAAKIAQTTPLIMAFALLPALAGLAFIKPNLGAAFFARSPSVSSLVTGAVLFGVATLAFPHWPLHWLQTVRSSTIHTAPLRTVFGFVGVASILRWRRPEARLLFVMTVVPHGLAFYDELPLWLVAMTRHEAMVLTAASWFACFAWLGVGDAQFMHSGIWSTAFLYLPATALVLRRANRGSVPRWIEERAHILPAWLRGDSAIEEPNGGVDARSDTRSTRA
jgi:hypothetical protein